MEKPGTRPGFFVFLYCFKYTYRTITNMPLFGKFDVLWFVDCGRVFNCVGGLTRFGKTLESSRFGVRDPTHDGETVMNGAPRSLKVRGNSSAEELPYPAREWTHR